MKKGSSHHTYHFIGKFFFFAHYAYTNNAIKLEFAFALTRKNCWGLNPMLSTLYALLSIELIQSDWIWRCNKNTVWHNSTRISTGLLQLFVCNKWNTQICMRMQMHLASANGKLVCCVFLSVFVLRTRHLHTVSIFSRITELSEKKKARKISFRMQFFFSSQIHLWTREKKLWYAVIFSVFMYVSKWFWGFHFTQQQRIQR